MANMPYDQDEQDFQNTQDGWEQPPARLSESGFVPLVGEDGRVRSTLEPSGATPREEVRDVEPAGKPANAALGAAGVAGRKVMSGFSAMRDVRAASKQSAAAKAASAPKSRTAAIFRRKPSPLL
jgi:hypothetical protein